MYYNYFYMSSLVVSGTFILLCNHYHRPSPELFSSSKTETPLIPHFLLPIASSSYHSILCLYDFDYSKYLM